MIRQQTIGVRLPTGFETGLPKGIEEFAPIVIVEEYRFTPVPSAGDMVKSTFVLNPEGTGHRCILSGFQLTRQYCVE